MCIQSTVDYKYRVQRITNIVKLNKSYMPNRRWLKVKQKVTFDINLSSTAGFPTYKLHTPHAFSFHHHCVCPREAHHHRWCGRFHHPHQARLQTGYLVQMKIRTWYGSTQFRPTANLHPTFNLCRIECKRDLTHVRFNLGFNPCRI